MFESLDDQIKHDAQQSSSPRERILVWVSVAVISVLVFGGLYFGVQMMSG